MTALLLDDVSTKLHLATAFTVQLGGHHGLVQQKGVDLADQ